MSDILEQSFGEVVALIRRARHNAYQTVNTILVDLYWQVGQYISQKVDSAAWGEGVIDRLAQYISEHHLDLRGFNRRNLFRMKQLYESYCYDKKVAPLVRQLPWAHNLIILSKCKLHEEREFYIRLAIKERMSKRELEHQINACLFERKVVIPLKVSPAVTQIYPSAQQEFKDMYLLDFLDLPERHVEKDLQSGFITDLKGFLVELGSDFCFVGEKYRLQVGRQDFFVDLLFFSSRTFLLGRF